MSIVQSDPTSISNMTDTIWPLLPAAGVGKRMQANMPKQYLPLNGKMLIDHTLERMLAYPAFSKLTLVLTEGDPYWPESQYFQHDAIQLAPGGSERCYSVLNGLQLIAKQAKETDWVLVHDVARPCVRHSDLDKLVAALVDDSEGGILASPTRDTMKRGLVKNGKNCIQHTVEREQLWHALTPQVFRLGALKSALEKSLAEGFEVTDEASAIEYAGGSPILVEGRADNLKVTRPDDLDLAAYFLSKQKLESTQG